MTPHGGSHGQGTDAFEQGKEEAESRHQQGEVGFGLQGAAAAGRQEVRRITPALGDPFAAIRFWSDASAGRRRPGLKVYARHKSDWYIRLDFQETVQGLRHDIDDLIQALSDTSEGSELSIGDILGISWSTPDPVIDKAARDAWVRLQHFGFDADARARGLEYDKRLRAEMKWRKDELGQLMSGSDPYGRRLTFLSRLRHNLRHWAQLVTKR